MKICSLRVLREVILLRTDNHFGGVDLNVPPIIFITELIILFTSALLIHTGNSHSQYSVVEYTSAHVLIRNVFTSDSHDALLN